MFRIFLTNLGKYNEGELVGKWVDLPCDDFDTELEDIGIGEEYEEYFITDYENDFGYRVEEYSNIDELNDLAEKLEDLRVWEADIVSALVSDGFDIEEAIEKVDDVIVYGDCETMEDVAWNYVEETGLLDEVPEELQLYIDCKKLGQDMEIRGHFIHFEGMIYQVIA